LNNLSEIWGYSSKRGCGIGRLPWGRWAWGRGEEGGDKAEEKMRW